MMAEKSTASSDRNFGKLLQWATSSPACTASACKQGQVARERPKFSLPLTAIRSYFRLGIWVVGLRALIPWTVGPKEMQIGVHMGPNLDKKFGVASYLSLEPLAYKLPRRQGCRCCVLRRAPKGNQPTKPNPKSLLRRDYVATYEGLGS